jgi:hypothetical protein
MTRHRLSPDQLRRRRQGRAWLDRDLDLLWEHGEAGWHPSPAGLANETDARMVRAVVADAWSRALFRGRGRGRGWWMYGG